MTLRYDKVEGIWHRPGDRLILDDVHDVYDNVPARRGDVLLDLGAHIGAATRLMLAKGVTRSIAVEADPANVAILRKNTARLPVTIVPAAVGPKAGRAAFYTRPDRSFVGSTIGDVGRKRQVVPVVSFGALLNQYRPTIVKCDIEFSEYGLPWTLPDHVRVLAMEVHIRYVGVFTGRKLEAAGLRERREAAVGLINAIEAQGFACAWRKDKQVTPKQAAGGEGPADLDDTGLGAMTKCVCATWVRA